MTNVIEMDRCTSGSSRIITTTITTSTNANTRASTS